MHYVRQLLIYLLPLLFLLLPTQIGHTSHQDQPTNEKRVLFISSYSYSWGSVPLQIKGINKALADGYIINYEFMDTKNTTYSKGYKEFYDLLKYKLNYRLPYDAIIVGDDAALLFAQQYRDELFPNIPIVYEGIDNIENAASASADPLITGVVEKVDYAKNIELARTINPEAKKVVFILDDAENGVGIAKQLANSQAAFGDLEVSYLNSANYTLPEFCKHLRELDNSSIVFCISMSKGLNNRLYTEEDRFYILTNYTTVPLYRVTQAGVGEGNFLGGYVISHDKCGEIAGEMVKKILSENGYVHVPPLLNTPQDYYFDANVLERYGIRASLLPANSTIVNKKMSFLQKYYLEFFVVLSLILLLILLVLLHQKNENNQVYKAYTKKLEESNAALILANKYKTDFFSRMSHDIRTPMNIIIGMTDLAKENTNPSATDDCLNKIKEASKFLLGLVNDVLDMAKVESGAIELHYEPYSFPEFTNYITSIAQPLCEQKGLTFNFIEPEKIYGVLKMDKLRINQIFFNLFSNAAKFTPEGGTISLQLKLQPLEQRPNYYGVTTILTDTGIGMSEEFQKHLFEQFSQEEQSKQAEHEGSGLGLSIVKKIVDLMHGTITVQSKLGQGTTFTTYFEFEQAPPEAVASTKDEQLDFSYLEGKHVLVCEDHPLNQQLIKHILTKIGVLVTIADNGQRGLEVFQKAGEHYYQAILMDIRMPVMNGLEATRKIRALPRADASQIPIIAMTANAFKEDRAEALEAGMNEHLTKPIDPTLLYTILLHEIHAYLD